MGLTPWNKNQGHVAGWPSPAPVSLHSCAICSVGDVPQGQQRGRPHLCGDKVKAPLDRDRHASCCRAPVKLWSSLVGLFLCYSTKQNNTGQPPEMWLVGKKHVLSFMWKSLHRIYSSQCWSSLGFSSTCVNSLVTVILCMVLGQATASL